MVLQVGDKVLVYGAGTPWAYAKKIEPVKVGDKVDVVTLSDGTKLSMPRISLNTDDYVWVVPTWDLPFNIGDIPFSWETIPLGAAVFTVTDVTCRTIQDTLREWEEHVLDGCLLINWYTDQTTKQTRKNQHEITSHTEHEYYIKASDIPAPMDGGFDFGFEYWIENTSMSSTPEPAGTWHPVYDGSPTGANSQGLYQRCNLSGAVSVSFKWRCLMESSPDSATRIDLTLEGQGASKNVQYRLQSNTVFFEEYGLRGNPAYPDYDIATISLGINSQLYYYDSMVYLTTFTGRNYHMAYDIEIDYLHFLDVGGQVISEPCVGGVAVGDKYVIYDPVTKRLIFNDSTKLLTAANWVTGGTGAEILSSPVEYVWDGQGHVYLTQNKTSFSTIQFDDMLQVQVVHGSSLEVLPMHLGERITVSGETVSRELTDITSVLTAGNNTITLIARNVDGTKVGFVTPVYVKRSMTVVSL